MQGVLHLLENSSSTFELCQVEWGTSLHPHLHVGWKNAYAYADAGWEADESGQFRHHLSASPAVIVRKIVGHHLFLNIIPSNFTARTELKVWCDRGMSDIALKLPSFLSP